MKKLFYLSSTDFAQVDLGFLHLLSNNFRLSYNVIITKNPNYNEFELAEYCVKNNIPLKFFYIERRARDPRVAFDFYKILKDIKRNQPDIIYTTSFDNPVMSLMCLMLNNKKTIISLHDVIFHSGTPFLMLFRFSRKIIVSHFKFFQVFSKNQEIVFKNQNPHKKIYTIPLTLTNLSSINSEDQSGKIKDNIIRFLFFGNILPYKGLEALIKAFNNISDKHSNVELTIAGRCETWEKDYAPLLKNNISINTIIGYIDNKDVSTLFKNAHYLILPYKDATQSGPLMIAYHFNLPVIASDIVAFQDTVKDGVSGFLYKAGDPKALENKMEEACLIKNDDYLKLLQKQKNFVQAHFSTKIIAEQYIEMFENFNS